MHPVKHGKDVRDRALHAQRDPGHPGGPQRRQRRFVHGLRVGLDRHLAARGEPELAVDRGQDAGELSGRQQRRRAAAEEHARRLRYLGPEHLTGEPDLGGRLAGVRRTAGPAAELGCGVGVEVAVSAPGLAERHMHIDAERTAHQARRRTVGQGAVARRGLTGGRRARHGSPLALAPWQGGSGHRS